MFDYDIEIYELKKEMDKRDIEKTVNKYAEIVEESNSGLKKDYLEFVEQFEDSYKSTVSVFAGQVSKLCPELTKDYLEILKKIEDKEAKFFFSCLSVGHFIKNKNYINDYKNNLKNFNEVIESARNNKDKKTFHTILFVADPYKFEKLEDYIEEHGHIFDKKGVDRNE